MKKILIIGSSGAGKSTLAKRLHEILGIEIIHLDQHYWQRNWTRTDEEVWQRKVEKILEGKNEWIMDGNYRSTMHLRIPQADTIVWLDFFPIVCLYRIFKRRLKDNRADEIDGCKERVTFELIRWALWKFPRENRKDILKRIEEVKNEKDVFVLKSNKEIEDFLDKLKIKE